MPLRLTAPVSLAHSWCAFTALSKQPMPKKASECDPLSTHVEPRGGANLYVQPMSNPVAAPSSTFNPYRTQRLHGPHLREDAVFHKCTLPPERALSGLSWAFPGSGRGSPPGDGMDTADRHLPTGAAQSGPRGGPESGRLSCNGLILGIIFVPVFHSNLHTVLPKVSKWGPQKLSKGRVIVAPTIHQQSTPTIHPKAYLK